MIEFVDAAQRLAMAALVGGAVGLNRNVNGKPVGVKTLALVSVGAAAFTMAGTDFVDAGRWDAASRVIQGIATGVGFVGAGAILKNDKEENIEGLTTATSVWVTAALGCACGLGEWRIAGLATLVALVVLLLGSRVEALAQRLLGRKE
jgi:putative Mg2+ transporter-C (MgtC) family protein